MSKQPTDWQDVNDWQDIGSIMEPPKSEARKALEVPDFLKSSRGYIPNPVNPNVRRTGTITARDDKGKVYEINIPANTIPALVPGLIEGNIRNRPENQISLMDRIKRTPFINPFGTGNSGVDIGNVAEGIQSVLPTPRNALRTGGAIIGGLIGGGAGAAGAAPTVAGIPVGAVAGATIGGASGASIGESIYQIGDRLINGGENAPKTAGEAATAQGGALVQGALQEGGGAVVAKGIGKLSNMLAERQVAKILAPSGNAMKADIAATASELSKDLPVGVTDKHLLGRVSTKVNGLGQAVEDAYATLRPTAPPVPSAPIVKALNDAKDAYMIQGKPIPGLENVVADYQQLIDGIGKNPTLTIDEFRKVKQGWDAAINWSRTAQARTPAMEKALTDGANAIRATLHNISPALEKADAQFSLWKTAQDSLQNKVTNAVGRPLLSGIANQGNIVSGAIGGGIGQMVGHPGAGIAAAETLNLLMGTTAYRSSSLAVKAAVQKAIQQGATQKAIGLILAQGAMSAEEGVRKLMVPTNVPRTTR